jgi:hypothetical protein
MLDIDKRLQNDSQDQIQEEERADNDEEDKVKGRHDGLTKVHHVVHNCCPAVHSNHLKYGHKRAKNVFI